MFLPTRWWLEILVSESAGSAPAARSSIELCAVAAAGDFDSAPRNLGCLNGRKLCFGESEFDGKRVKTYQERARSNISEETYCACRVLLNFSKKLGNRRKLAFASTVIPVSNGAISALSKFSNMLR